MRRPSRAAAGAGVLQARRLPVSIEEHDDNGTEADWYVGGGERSVAGACARAEGMSERSARVSVAACPG